MTKQFAKDAFGWGFILWFIGYALGIVLFAVVPPEMIGWVLMPIGTILTLGVLSKKVKGNSLGYYLGVAVVWTLLAIICDYFLLVIPFKLMDTYYKTDIYLYYGLTFVLPIAIGWRKTTIKK